MTDQQFKEILLPLYRQMYGVAMAILADRHAAADSVQEAMMSLWLKRVTLDPDGPVKSYAMTAVRNNCISYVRGNSQKELLDVEEIRSLTAPARDEAETEASANSTASLIGGVIRDMPENMRQVMELSVFGECDNREIQEITGFSAANVRTLLSRGRKELRSVLMKRI